LVIFHFFPEFKPGTALLFFRETVFSFFSRRIKSKAWSSDGVKTDAVMVSGKVGAMAVGRNRNIGNRGCGSDGWLVVTFQGGW
jgi:hypothetical protein